MKVLLWMGILILLFYWNVQEGFEVIELQGDRGILKSFLKDNIANASVKLKDLKLNDELGNRRSPLLTKYESGGPPAIDGKDGTFDGDTTLIEAIRRIDFRLKYAQPT